jgi:hypothetical protein
MCRLRLRKVRSLPVPRSLLSIVFLLLIGCASIQPPPGGPEDKTPPTILETTPKERAINIPRDGKIHFVFAEAVDKSGFPQAFSITPYVNGKIKYSWSGLKEVTVILPENLRENSTYTVSLSRDLKSRRGNALVTPLHLTFSTGPAIDTGRLDGFVLPAIGSNDPVKTSEIYLFAYDLAFHRSDTLNYSTTPPDLLTQPDDKGAFAFLAMKTSHTYRIFAVQDQFRNHLYDKGVDNYGMPASDALLDSVIKTDFRIRMAANVDTIKPELQDVSSTDGYHLRAAFSEAIDSASLRLENFRLSAMSDHAVIPLAAIFRDRPEKHPGEVVLLSSQKLALTKEYKLEVTRDSVRDLAHNKLSDSAYSSNFTPIHSLDTIPAPKMQSVSIFDSIREISVTPAILVSFTDAVVHARAESAIEFSDSSKHVVAYHVRWQDDVHMVIMPNDTLKPRAFYALRVHTKFFGSPDSTFARGGQDTTFTIRFETVDFRDDGSLAGHIIVADSVLQQHLTASIVVQLLDASGVLQQQKVLSKRASDYLFERVTKGSYRVRAYLTESPSQLFDPGSVNPFRFAMPSGDFPGELSIRARWATEKVDFPIK